MSDNNSTCPTCGSQTQQLFDDETHCMNPDCERKHDVLIDDRPDVSTNRTTTALSRGKLIRTPLSRNPHTPDSSAIGSVHLRPGDEQCSTCGNRIEGFGPSGIMVLARLKRDRDETLCPSCLDDAQARSGTNNSTGSDSPEDNATAQLVADGSGGDS